MSEHHRASSKEEDPPSISWGRYGNDWERCYAIVPCDLDELEPLATMERRVNDRGTPEWRVVGTLRLERGTIRVETGAYYREAWAREAFEEALQPYTVVAARFKAAV